MPRPSGASGERVRRAGPEARGAAGESMQTRQYARGLSICARLSECLVVREEPGTGPAPGARLRRVAGDGWRGCPPGAPATILAYCLFTTKGSCFVPNPAHHRAGGWVRCAKRIARGNEGARSCALFKTMLWTIWKNRHVTEVGGGRLQSKRIARDNLVVPGLTS